MPKTFLALLVLCSSISYGQSTAPSYFDSMVTLHKFPSVAAGLEIPPDARSCGAGEAGLGLSPDANSLFWNTASLGLTRDRFGISGTYSPYFRQLVDDAHFLYFSSFFKINLKHTVGAFMRHFNMGPYFDVQENRIRDTEFGLAYAYSFNSKSSIGINIKYIRSQFGDPTDPILQVGQALATDISYRFTSNWLEGNRMMKRWNWGLTLSNMGNKVNYYTSNTLPYHFLPANFRLGGSLDLRTAKHRLTTIINTNKLMVPVAPIRDANGSIVSGYDNNVGSFVGMIQSFYDAPGQVNTNPNGTFSVEGRGLEELREWRLNFGFEYSYREFLFARTGLQLQHFSSSEQSFATFGLGAKWRKISADVSYLAAFRRTNPLANTIRFTLVYQLPVRA